MNEDAIRARWLHHLLVSVAADLDRLAISPTVPAEELTRRAMRIRQRIHEGPPEGWIPPQVPGREEL